MSIRQPRTTQGPNFKWDRASNFLAYCCYRVSEISSNREKIANKLGVKLSSFNNRIHHFKSLTKGSNDTTSKPSKEVVDIFVQSEAVSDDECRNMLKEFLASEYERPKVDEDLDFETEEVVEVENLDTTFKEYWQIQQKFQKYDMSQMQWEQFVKVVSTMNIKSRGIKIEKRIIKNSKLKKSVMSEEGDAWLEDGSGVEIKTSFITPLVGSSVSLTGLRLWESKVLHYLLVVVDLRDTSRDPITYVFWVPKDDLIKMDNEGLLNTPSLKKSAAMNNENVQKGLRIKINELAGWGEKYPAPAWLKI